MIPVELERHLVHLPLSSIGPCIENHHLAFFTPFAVPINNLVALSIPLELRDWLI